MQATLHLLDSAAVMTALALLFGILRRTIMSVLLQDLLLGSVFGIGAIVSMLQPILTVDHLIVDCRTLFVGFAGAFLGVRGALVAVVAAIAGRLMIGVSFAAVIGIFSLVGSAAMGCVWRQKIPQMQDVWAWFALLGLMISSSLLFLFLLPEFRHTERPAESVMALTMFNVFGSVVLGAFLYRESARAEREDRALTAAATDPLTGVLNRRGFSEQFASAERAIGTRGSAFLLVDLDHFKNVNDEYGHAFGDRVLRLTGDRIRGALRLQDVVMRVGGEEFGILLTDVDQQSAGDFAERLRLNLSSPCALSGRPDLIVTASIGGHWWATGSQSFGITSEIADRALYAAKAQGRNRTVFLA